MHLASITSPVEGKPPEVRSRLMVFEPDGKAKWLADFLSEDLTEA
jgi:hypothetical protein